VASGYRGTGASVSRSGAAVGPYGGAAASSRTAIGPGGGVAIRNGATTGYYGSASRTTAVAASRGTYYRSAAVVRGQGVYVRSSVASYPCFRSGWYTSHPGAWFAAGWGAGAVWRSASWNSCASYCSFVSTEPVYYDYGSSVVYQDDGVYMDGEMVASVEKYSEQAVTLADTGRAAKVSKDEEWLPLGVFALVQGEEKTSNHIFQLSVNKQGVIRGNYYDAVADSSTEVYGSVDRKSQRAAWTVGDRKSPVYEAGVANLTKAETSMMVHYGKDRSVQYTLVRLEEPKEE
jgi:hypothetical protein